MATTLLRALEATAAQHPVATIVYNDHFEIVDVNQATERLLGRERADLLGHSGLTYLHPDDLAVSARSLAADADPRRETPVIIRIIDANGEHIPVMAMIRSPEPPCDGVAYILSLMPAAFPASMDALLDALLTGADVPVLLDRVLAAAQATGHYLASIHHSVGFGGTGRLDTIVHAGIGDIANIGSPTIEAIARMVATESMGPLVVPAAELSMADVATASGATLHSAVFLPLRVKDVGAGVLVVWTYFPIGPFGQAQMERVGMIAELAVGRAIERAARGSIREVGDLTIDLVERTVTTGSRIAKLTPVESSIMGLLSDQPGRPVSREQIVQHLFGSTHVGDSRACDVHMRNLRAKLHDDPTNPRWIVTVRGIGYTLRPSRSTSH